MKSKKSFIFFCRYAVVGLFFLLFLGACAGGGGGASSGLRTSMEVEQFFQSATVLPDHRYYIQGVAANPEAIIAVKNSFQLRSKFWSPVDWTEKELKDAVFWMQVGEIGFCTSKSGYLTTPGAERVGIWYSQRDWIIVKQPEPGVVEVYPFDYIQGSPCHRQYLLDQR
ncbi:MAG: hypothetical protein ABFR63_09510 [Thermodesulfobacteriota bacterium]